MRVEVGGAQQGCNESHLPVPLLYRIWRHKQTIEFIKIIMTHSYNKLFTS